MKSPLSSYRLAPKIEDKHYLNQRQKLHRTVLIQLKSIFWPFFKIILMLSIMKFEILAMEICEFVSFRLTTNRILLRLLLHLTV